MKRKVIPKAVRRSVYEKYNGHCAYCGKEIEYKDMQVDHLYSVYMSELDGDEADNSIKNLMPACRACNFYKRDVSLDTFRNNLKTMHHRLNKQFLYRLAKQYDMITENEFTEFYFVKQNAKGDKNDKL